MAVTVSATNATSASASRVRMPRIDRVLSRGPIWAAGAVGFRSPSRARGLVAAATDREDQFRVDGVRLDLGAQPPDRHVDEARVAEVVVAPDAVQELVPGQDLTGALDQLGQQVELSPRQRNLLAVAGDGSAGRIDLQRTEADRRRPASPGGPRS